MQGWLIFCVNLTWLNDIYIAGKTPFPGVFVRVSGKRLAFEPVDRVKKTALTNAGGHHSIQQEPE